MKRVSKTQIMATPTLEGEDAERLLESLKFKPTEKSIKNGEELVEFFKKFENKKRSEI